MRASLFGALAFVALAFGASPALAADSGAAESRLALVIGNSNYKSSPLANPVNDARLMEAALKDAGFQVIKAENATIREMRRLVRDFGDRLKAAGGVGLFYFAGHGVQVRGENFLVSTDSDIRNEDEIADDAVNAQVILEKMQAAGNRMNLIVLDACRNNPFAVKSRSTVNGLATMSAPSGSLVAYSTAPGSVASDGNGKNGLYTQYLARTIAQPGLPVEEVFKQVRAAVRRDSNNQQTPWENTALEGQFYFKPPVQVAPAPEPPKPVEVAKPAAPDPALIEMEYWSSIKGSSSPGELQTYVNRYPNGIFTELAKARIATLQAASAAALEAAARTRAAEQRAAEQKAADQKAQQLAAVQPPPSTRPPAAQPAPAVPQPAEDLDSLGLLVINDLLTKSARTISVTVTARDANGTQYSTGDRIGVDGQLAAIRLGNFLFDDVASGKLWKLPLQSGASGEAKVRFEQNRSEPADIRWKVKEAGAQRGMVEVVMYFRASQGAFGGRRAAVELVYQDGLPIATAMKYESQPQSAVGGSGGNHELLSVELRRGARPTPAAQAQAQAQAATGPEPARGAAGAGELGTFLLRDRLTGLVQTITVTASPGDAGATMFSTGDRVGADGQVLGVRLGNVVITAVTSGKLWKLPLQAGASGEAKGTMVGINVEPADIRWKVSEAGAQQGMVEITMYYRDASFGSSKRASIELTYRSGLQFAAGVKFDARPTMAASSYSSRDFLVGELQGR